MNPMKTEKLTFEIQGTMRLGAEQRKFSKKVEAPTENAAREKAICLLGSNHGISRSKIQISSVKKA